jgi:hypothetical protein
MSTSLVQVELPPVEPPFALTQAQTILRKMVLDSVKSIHSSAITQKRSMICLRSAPANLSPVRC